MTAAAYANSWNGTTSTALFDIDSGSDKLRRQGANPSTTTTADPGNPNSGVLTDIGPLGVDASPDVSFDIAPSDGAALVAIRPEGASQSTLYSIDLGKGTATGIATIGSSEKITGIAIARQAPSAFALLSDGRIGLTSTVAGADAVGANATVEVTRRVAVTGLAPADALVGIDVRPADGVLVGASQTRAYSIDPVTGVAKQISGSTFAGSAANYGVDFNPTFVPATAGVPGGALRIIDDVRENFRIANGGTGNPITDGAINQSGATPAPIAAAYTNNFAGATQTTLYDIDAENPELAIQNPPNGGALTSVGTGLGVTLDGREAGFDILAQDGSALAALQTTATAAESTLLRIDLASGKALKVADFTSGTTVRGYTAATGGTIGLSSDVYKVAEGGTAAITVQRTTSEGTATVNYAVANGPSGALTFLPGETLKTFDVPTADDAEDNADRVVDVSISRAGGYGLGTTAAKLTVLDDDPTPASSSDGGGDQGGGGATIISIRDVLKPAVLVAVKDLRLKTLRSRGVSGLVSCNEGCTIVPAIKLGTRTIGTGPTTRLASAGLVRVRLKLSSSGKRLLGTGKTRLLRFAAAVTDVAGNVTTQASTFRAAR